MRFVHISDLHIGKKLKEASLEEEYRRICAQAWDYRAVFGEEEQR